MESNKDEALKCLAIAQKHRNAGNLPSAKRFCEKSLTLFSTPEGTRLLQLVEKELASEPSASSSTSSTADAGPSTGFSTSTEAHSSSSGTRQRHTESSSQANGSANDKAKGAPGAGEKKREYTPEQAAVVKRIRACKVTEYYEILSLKRDCEEVDIKKAYRKVNHEPFALGAGLLSVLSQLALSLHPDKNGAPGADEAFKSALHQSLLLSLYSSHCSGVESISSAIWYVSSIDVG